MDSVSLERTRCFGRCPTYRVVLTRAGVVRWEPRPPQPGEAASARFAPAALDSLARQAKTIGFWSLPSSIVDDAALCGQRATDHPGAAITFYSPGEVRQVVDDLGCRGATLVPLRQLEARIDSVAGTERWLGRG